ncbi:MAG: dicarboxylate/amino acid:cation symporter [Planctomycetota bacterium]
MTTSAASAKPWYLRLHYQIFAAMAVGLVLGFGLGAPAVSTVGWMGALFLRALRMVIVPLVLVALAGGVASIGTGRELGRIGLKTIGYYALSSFLAILLGLAILNAVRPGAGVELALPPGEAPKALRPGGIGEVIFRLVEDLVPPNPVRAMADGNMLGIIGFSLVLGLAVAHLPERERRPARRFLEVSLRVMTLLTGWVIRLAPLGVLGLIATAAAEAGFEAFRALATYILAVTAGLLVHLLVILPLLLRLLGGIRPGAHFRSTFEALVTAFSTSSSQATLPVTMRCTIENAGVSTRIASFVLPMGATVNMDGTALYECAAALFIAQILGYPLGFGEELVIVITAFAASVGTAAVPSAGLVMIFVVLDAVGLRGPQVDALVGTLLAIDRPLDMLRTVVNVFSDTCGAAIVARSEQGQSWV